MSHLVTADDIDVARSILNGTVTRAIFPDRVDQALVYELHRQWLANGEMCTDDYVEKFDNFIRYLTGLEERTRVRAAFSRFLEPVNGRHIAIPLMVSQAWRPFVQKWGVYAEGVPSKTKTLTHA